MNPDKKLIHGVRPTPLSINKGSHVIKKQSFPLSFTNKQNPVIIYAHSPKVIHTKPHDFMALVQKLTGLSRCEDMKENEGIFPMQEKFETKEFKAVSEEDEDEVSSPSKYEDCGREVKNSSLLAPPFSNQFLVDIPLFTPSSTNLFFSPRNHYQ